MNLNGAARYVVGLVLLLGFLSQRSVACHEVIPATKASEREPTSHTFVLDLRVSKSGDVRSVEVLIGSGPLRTKAIRAATRRIYKRPPGQKSDVITVEVKFRHATDRVAEIREIALGVPGCIYVTTPIRIALPLLVSGPAWINQLLSGQQIVPVIDSADQSKSQQ